MNLYNSFLLADGLRGQPFEHKKVLANPTDAKTKEYIMWCYKNRGKNNVFNLAIPQANICKKSIHTFSVFFLGILLQDIIDNRLKALFETTFNNTDEFEFIYIWFLSCLYHDTTSAIEHIDKHDIPPCYTVEDYLKYLRNSLEHLVYDELNLGRWLIPKLITTHSKTTVDRYFRYRLESGSYDHGIGAGYIVYDKLVNIYINEMRKQRPDDIHDNGLFSTWILDNNTNRKPLTWRPEQLWVFALIADAIIAHNIWYADSRSIAKKDIESVRAYKTFGLDDLVVDDHNDQRIDMVRNPLAFFLGLIDTIEPVKFFDYMNPRFVWDNISIDLKTKDRRRIIVISQSGSVFDFQKWYEKKMKELHVWLKIDKVQEPKDGFITIQLPN